MDEKKLIGESVGALSLRDLSGEAPAVRNGVRQLASLGRHEWELVGTDWGKRAVWRLRFGDGKQMLIVTKADGTITKA